MPPDPIRLLVADDEALARRLVRQYAAGCAGVEIVRECANTTLETALADGAVDAALLDVRMPGPDLFDVLSQASAQQSLPALVFATAYDRYAVRAFDLNAVDYLVKPFTAARFEAAIERLRDRRRRGTSGEGLPRLLRDLGRRPDRLLVPDGRRMVPLALTAITWIRAEGDYARIHAEGKSYLVYRTLNDLETRLDPAEFLRIHRSAIVRLSQISEVQPADSSRYRLVLTDGTVLIVSRSRAATLKRLIL